MQCTLYVHVNYHLCNVRTCSISFMQCTYNHYHLCNVRTTTIIYAMYVHVNYHLCNCLITYFGPDGSFDVSTTDIERITSKLKLHGFNWVWKKLYKKENDMNSHARFQGNVYPPMNRRKKIERFYSQLLLDVSFYIFTNKTFSCMIRNPNIAPNILQPYLEPVPA